MTWHKHTPGDPMPVDGDTLVHVCFRVEDPADRRKRGAAEPAKNFRWDCAGTNGDIIAYRIVEPAEPAPRWVSVEEQPHPIGKWFWTRAAADTVEPMIAYVPSSNVRFWHPMEQPPAFTPPALTDAEKLAIAVEAMKRVHNSAYAPTREIIDAALAKIGGGE